MNPTPDDVAVDVIRDAGGKGAVMFTGWLGSQDPPLPDAAVDYPLYTDQHFLQWLVIPADAIIAQVSGANFADGRSSIWVKREARITRCESNYAYWFDEAPIDASDDPTTRHPPP